MTTQTKSTKADLATAIRAAIAEHGLDAVERALAAALGTPVAAPLPRSFHLSGARQPVDADADPPTSQVPAGVWAGLTADERRQVRRALTDGSGRPEHVSEESWRAFDFEQRARLVATTIANINQHRNRPAVRDDTGVIR